jgi:hypothetical protein
VQQLQEVKARLSGVRPYFPATDCESGQFLQPGFIFGHTCFNPSSSGGISPGTLKDTPTAYIPPSRCSSFSHRIKFLRSPTNFQLEQLLVCILERPSPTADEFFTLP